MPKVTIDRTRAREFSAAVAFSERKRPDRKYNIKLLSDDYDMIKLAAEMESKSASYFVSYLVYNGVYSQLSEMIGRNSDALVLIASKADSDAEYDIISTPWLYDVLHRQLQEIVTTVTGETEGEPEALVALLGEGKKTRSHLFNIIEKTIGSQDVYKKEK